MLGFGPVGPALAQERPVVSHLSWERGPGAETCAGEAEIREGVETRLERTVFGPREEAELLVEGRMDRTAGGFAAHIVLRHRDGPTLGVRDVESDAVSCDELSGSIALVVALMVDLPREEIRLRLPAAPAPPPPPPAEVSPARRWGIDGGAGATVSVGLLASAAFGPRIFTSIRPPRFAVIELEAGGLLSGDADIGPGERVRLDAWYGGVALCAPLYAGDRVRLRACAGCRAGLLTASARGFDVDGHARRPFVELSLAPLLQVRLAGPLFVQAGASLGIPVRRDRFVITEPDGSETVAHRPRPVTGAFDLSVGVAVP